MDNESWDITPNNSNIAESAHASTNAATTVGVSILTAILEYVIPHIIRNSRADID